MPSFSVYAYFNVDQLATLFDGIAAITGSGNFLDIFKIVAMLSFLVFVAGLAVNKSQDPFEFFRWLMIVVLVHAVLLVPKADVVLVDRTGAAPPTVRANVPIGLAFFASVTSHVGDAITRAFETVFALPDDLQFQKNGIMFGNTVLVDSLQAVPVNPAFRDDLIKFINSCTYYDMIAGRISQDDFARSADVWTSMSNTSNTLSTPLSTAASGSMPCSEAYTDISNRWAAEIASTMQTRGRVLNPAALSNVAAAALLGSQIANSYAQLTNISQSATTMLRQNMALNSVRDSQMVSAQRLDSASSAIVGAAQAQAEMTANTNYITMARVAERAGPGIRNVIELICYAVFPLVILLLIVAGEHAGKVLKTYVMSLVWIQLIPPLYAVLNFAMTTASRHALVGIAESSTSAAAVTLVNIGQLSQRGLSESAIAGYLTLSLPLIAWALVKGGEIGGAALFNAAFAPALGGSSAAANQMATGNVNQGNVSLDTAALNTVSANKYDTAPSLSSGFTRAIDGAGASISGMGGIYRYQANQSSLGFSANFGQKIGNALSSEAADRMEVANRETTAATQMRTAALVERMGILKAYSDQHGSTSLQDASHSARSSEAVSQLQQIAENVNERLGQAASSSVGQRIVGTLSLGGSIGFDAKFVSAKAGADVARVNDSSKQKTFEAALGYARDQLRSRNVTSEQALSNDFRSSDAFQWGEQNRSESVSGQEAALTKATQHTHNAEAARSQAFTLSNQARVVSENWLHSSMNYEGYLANRLHEDGKLDAFNMLYQTNPERAATMAAHYLAETNFDVMPTMPAISANIHDVQRGSPELAGKTTGSETKRLGAPADATGSAYHRYQATVQRGGYQQPDVLNNVGERIQAGDRDAHTAVDKARGDVEPQVAAGHKKAEDTLERTKMGPGMTPGPSEKPAKDTAAGLQDRAHNDLFNRPDAPPKK